MAESEYRPNRAIVTINNVQLAPIEIDKQRVVTLSMIDKVHGRPDGTARRTFNANRSRMKEGQHYFVRNSSEASALGITAPNGLTVLTERGYLMLVKSFTDDLAWQVQDALVESYFVKAEQVTSRSRPVRLDVSREHRLALNLNLKMAKMAGLIGNQALLSASRATQAMTGVDHLNLMGLTHMTAPQNEALLTPTEVGRRSGIGSAQAVNNRLCDMGLQHRFLDAKNHPYYEPTEAGKRAGGVMQDTGKHHSNGTPVRQLKWSSSIIGTLTGGESIAA